MNTAVTIVEQLRTHEHTLRLLKIHGWNQVWNYCHNGTWKTPCEIYRSIGFQAATSHNTIFCLTRIMDTLQTALQCPNQPVNTTWGLQVQWTAGPNNNRRDFIRMNKTEIKKLVHRPPMPPTIKRNPMGTQITPTALTTGRLTFSQLLPQHRYLMWRLQRNCLPTGYKFLWSEQIPPWCYTNCAIIENPHHLFWSCPNAQYQWKVFLPAWQELTSTPITWNNIINVDFKPLITLRQRLGKLYDVGLGIVIGCICFRIWKNRNAHRFDSILKCNPANELQIQIHHDILRHFASLDRRCHSGKRESPKKSSYENSKPLSINRISRK